MGGFGSGAARQWLHVEEVRSLDVDPLLRGLRADEWLLGSTYIHGLRVEYEVSVPHQQLRLKWEQGANTHRQMLALLPRRTPTGGTFWLVECPTGRPVRRLYLPSGCDRWAGRQAYHLKHRSTAESPLDRAARRLRKSHQKLADRGVVLDESGWVAHKPRHRRWDWIERRLRDVGDAREAWDAQFVLEASALLGIGFSELPSRSS